MKPNISYRFYATLLDGFQDYLDSEQNYEKFYSNPDRIGSPTPDEYDNKAFWDLLNRINRVPFESEAADKGTAFNDVIDCLIANESRTEKTTFTIDEQAGKIFTQFKNRNFAFPLNICREFAEYYEGAVSQVFVSAIVPTKYGNVEVYGYIDELMPFSIHDIKSTKFYEAFKFRKHWQHRVYPYCMWKRGDAVQYFEYNVTDFNDTYTERYEWVPERDIPILVDHCERLIEFLEAYRPYITDKKIFNLEE